MFHIFSKNKLYVSQLKITAIYVILQYKKFFEYFCKFILIVMHTKLIFFFCYIELYLVIIRKSNLPISRANHL